MGDAVRLVVFGSGYSGAAVAAAAGAAGFGAVAISRRNDATTTRTALLRASHVLSTVPPEQDHDPVLLHYGRDLDRAPALRWVGYLSTTGVYGDRGGELGR